MVDETRKEELRAGLTAYVESITEKDRRAGNNMYKCPLCGSGTGRNHNGAFSITRDGKSWKCFSCNQGGDIFTLIGNIKEANMKDTTFYQALFRCYLPNREATPNCRQCPLFAQGHSPNDECRRMLNDEIRHRKCEARKKEAI